MCLCLMLCVSGCKENIVNNNISDDRSVTKYSEARGRYFEETPSGYKAGYYEKTEIEAEKIKEWADSCPSGENYYQYIYSDPDSWDMFIYYSPAEGGLQYSGFAFCIEGSTVKIYVTNTESPYGVRTDYIFIRIQAPLRGSWPDSSELYVNDEKIIIQNSDLP